jgi:hypothetical protein
LSKMKRPVLANEPKNLGMSRRFFDLCTGAGNATHKPPARSVSQTEVGRG